jgi:hypothetical protein
MKHTKHREKKQFIGKIIAEIKKMPWFIDKFHVYHGKSFMGKHGLLDFRD